MNKPTKITLLLQIKNKRHILPLENKHDNNPKWAIQTTTRNRTS